jgi:hypothetical protein
MRLVLPRPRRGAIALLTVGLLAPLAVAVAPSASAACAGRTNRAISGVVYGVDNMDVNVSIGYDVESTSGKIINVSDGCPKTAGYSAPVQEKNHYVSGDGAARDSVMSDAKGGTHGRTVRSWSLTGLPSNAKSVWIEVYARAYTGSPCPTCMGRVDTHKYGFVTRRQVAVGSTNVMLRLPLNCGYAGGSNGAIGGSVTRGGKAVQPDHVYAWSTLKDQNYTIMGWGTGTTSSGTYTIAALASGQPYTMQLTYGGVTYTKKNVTVSKCATKTVNWAI